MMLPPFMRIGLMLLIAFTGLIAAVLVTSGALQPVRVFLVGRTMRGPGAIMLGSESGDLITLTLAHESSSGAMPFENQLAWVNDESEVVVWKNGHRQTLGHLSEASVQGIHWSPNGQLAWSDRSSGTPDLMLWNGETTRNLTSGSETAEIFYWVGENDLLWTQKTDQAEWQIMHWQGTHSTILYSEPDDEESFVTAADFTCGALALGSEKRGWLYQQGSLNPLPASPNIIPFMISDNCQTFLVNDLVHRNFPSYDLIWNGQVEQEVSFWAQGIRGDDEFIGIEPNDDIPKRLTLVYQQGTRFQKNVWETQRFIAEAFPLFWEDEMVFWRVAQPDSITILHWNIETNELISFPGSANVNGVYWRDEASRRAAWFSFPELSEINLTVWENGQLSQHTLPISTEPIRVFESAAHWMNDGSLLIMLRQGTVPASATPVYTALYRWDGSTLAHITDMPFGARPLSDWMTWE